MGCLALLDRSALCAEGTCGWVGRSRGCPRVRERFRRGELSYSKVRAITRIATAEIEAELVEMARFATAAQLEGLVRGYRRAASLESAEAAHRDRFLSYEWDDDGSLCVRARLAPENGALFLKALEPAAKLRPASARTRNRRTFQGGSAEPRGGSGEPQPTGRVNRADALMEVAEGSLGRQCRRPRPAGERYQVVVHADAEALSGEGGAGRLQARRWPGDLR